MGGVAMIPLTVGLIFLAIGGACFLAYNPDEDNGGIIPLGFVIGIIGGILMGDYFYDLGVEKGAYNMLRNKYEVSYIINKDSIITDTIIYIN